MHPTKEMLAPCVTALVWWMRLVSKSPQPSSLPTLPGEGHPPPNTQESGNMSRTVLMSIKLHSRPDHV